MHEKEPMKDYQADFKDNFEVIVIYFLLPVSVSLTENVRTEVTVAQ
jgi:hypothetical protein